MHGPLVPSNVQSDGSHGVCVGAALGTAVVGTAVGADVGAYVVAVVVIVVVRVVLPQTSEELGHVLFSVNATHNPSSRWHGPTVPDIQPSHNTARELQSRY